MNEGVEKIKSGKEILKELETEGKYLFHGSPNGEIKVFEPRQSLHVPDTSKVTETIPDGNPGVSASPYPELAIFRAIINGKNVEIDHTNGFGSTGPTLQYNVSSKEVLERAKGKNGYVYVFNRSDFTPYSRLGEANEQSMEWRSYKEVEPIQVVEVKYDDMPDESEIEII